MDDFIDDTEDKIDISKEIRSIFGYVLTKKPDLTSLLEFVILTLVIIEINGPYGTEFFFFFLDQGCRKGVAQNKYL